MVNSEAKNGQTKVTISPSTDFPVQEEIVQMITGTLMALRDNVVKNGGDPASVDKDADLIFHNAYMRYHQLVTQNNEKNVLTMDPARNVKANNTMDNIMQQVDQMLDENGNKKFYS